MQHDKKKFWFPAKRYGWGWGPPICWQGWVVFAVWLALLIGGAIYLVPGQPELFVAYTMVITGILVIICWIKGEPPRWRWGKD